MTITFSDSNLYGGTSILVGAGTPATTLPARSNFDPWQGQKNPPEASSKFATLTSFGEQPKCVQRPSKTANSGFEERQGLTAKSGCISGFSEFGSAKESVVSLIDFNMASVRLTTNTGLPRQATTGVNISPG